ncbi:MAG: hypothetical protein ACYC0J_08635 [Gammaproteobacteria bacterium]
MIINYEALENILAMDFSELRAVKIGVDANATPEELAVADSCATDEAIFSFVNNLAIFFKQFPTSFQLFSLSKTDSNEYKSYLEKIIKKVNESEYTYYLVKYSQDINAEMMARTTACIKPTDSNALARRMQYWAAGERFGDTMRNPELHQYVVKQMKKWSCILPSVNKKSSLVSQMFQVRFTESSSSSSSSAMTKLSFSPQ